VVNSVGMVCLRYFVVVRVKERKITSERDRG
jgi:hypothetical protein